MHDRWYHCRRHAYQCWACARHSMHSISRTHEPIHTNYNIERSEIRLALHTRSERKHRDENSLLRERWDHTPYLTYIGMRTGHRHTLHTHISVCAYHTQSMLRPYNQKTTMHQLRDFLDTLCWVRVWTNPLLAHSAPSSRMQLPTYHSILQAPRGAHVLSIERVNTRHVLRHASTHTSQYPQNIARKYRKSDSPA